MTFGLMRLESSTRPDNGIVFEVAPNQTRPSRIFGGYHLGLPRAETRFIDHVGWHTLYKIPFAGPDLKHVIETSYKSIHTATHLPLKGFNLSFAISTRAMPNENGLWRPYGLIRHRDMESLYDSALFTEFSEDSREDPSKSATVDLFLQLFRLYNFASSNYLFTPQGAPSADSNESCDLVIKYHTAQRGWQPLCFIEAKSQADVQIGDLEDRVKKYCEEYLRTNPEPHIVYAMTIVGVRVRCWRYSRGCDKLQAFWNSTETRTLDHYLDVGEDKSAAPLGRVLHTMKSTPPYALPWRVMDYTQFSIARYYGAQWRSYVRRLQDARSLQEKCPRPEGPSQSNALTSGPLDWTIIHVPDCSSRGSRGSAVRCRN